MTDVAMWSLLVGFVSPLLIAVVQRPTWTKATRAAVTFGSSMLLGAGTAYFNGDLSNARSMVSSCLLVLVAGVSTYQSFWKQISVTQVIEAKTSPSAHVVEAPVTEQVVETTEPAAAAKPAAARVRRKRAPRA